MSAFESAIDDTFGVAAQPIQDEDGSDDSIFDNAYQGPRDGHWDVTSSVGSFIDDRVPSVYGYGHRPCANGRGAQIDEGLAKKLMQATIEEKRNTATAAAKDISPASMVSNRTKQPSTPLEAKAPKPFFVPPVRNRSYNPVMPDIAVATNDTTPPLRANSTKTQQDPRSSPALPAAATHHTPPPAAARADDASVRPDPSPSAGRTIRILGKNGEVAFVNLPSLPKTYPSASESVNPAAMAKKVENQQEPKSGGNKQHHPPVPKTGGNDEKNLMIPAVSDKIAIKKTSQTQDDPWANVSPANEANQNQSAHSLVMSGALPITSPWAQSSPQFIAQSCKDSGVAMGGMSAAAPKAGSHKTVSTGHGSAISQGVFSVAKQIANMPSTPRIQSRAASVAPLPQLFEEVGMGVTTGFPAQKRMSERSNRSMGRQSSRSQRSSLRNGRNDAPSEAAGFQQFGSVGGSQRMATSKLPSLEPIHERSRQVSRASNYKPPTVHSGSSSSSITHAFGGFHQDGFVQQADTQIAPLNNKQGSLHHRQAHSESGKNERKASDNLIVKITPPPRNLHLKTTDPTSPLDDWSRPPCPSHSPVSILAPSPYPSHASKPKIKFAGDGWISPHPLSVASTDIGAAPQSAVYISGDGPDHIATLTYTEWRAQRDAARSVAGSFAGSHVPSAVELHTVTPAVYNHPPPADYSGSYERRIVRSHQPKSQVGRDPAWHDQQEHATLDHDAAGHTAFLLDRQRSLHSHVSVHSHPPSVSTRHNNSVYNDPVRHTPSVLGQDAGWDFEAQHNGSALGPVLGPRRSQVSGSNVGLTQSELAKYQSQLSSTISRHSSRLSHVQQERSPPQPDYNVWNSGQSHATVRAASHHSAQVFPSNLPYPRETSQLAMPWDPVTSHVGTPSAFSQQARLQHGGSALGGVHSAVGAQGLGSALSVPLRGGNGSVASQSLVNEFRSQATYGTVEWQDLEDAKDGQGRFQSRQDYRTW